MSNFPEGVVSFDSRVAAGVMLPAFFRRESGCFGLTEEGKAQRMMVKFRVDDPDALLASSLTARGVRVDEHREIPISGALDGCGTWKVIGWSYGSRSRSEPQKLKLIAERPG